MNTAAAAREAIRRHPSLLVALRAGVLNYSAAARFLDLEDVDAGAAALRRYANELPAYVGEPPELRIRVLGEVGPISDPSEALLVVGETHLGEGEGDWSAVLATGEIAPADAGGILEALRVQGIEPVAAGAEPGRFVLVVERGETHTAIRAVEETVTG